MLRTEREEGVWVGRGGEGVKLEAEGKLAEKEMRGKMIKKVKETGRGRTKKGIRTLDKNKGREK